MDTKELLLNDIRRSGKTLGEYALAWMKTYDDISYRLAAGDRTTLKGKMIRGTADFHSREVLDEFIRDQEIEGDYKIIVIDAQYEFLRLLDEIQREA